MDPYKKLVYELRKGSESMRPGDGSYYWRYLTSPQDIKTSGEPSKLEDKSREKEGILKLS